MREINTFTHNANSYFPMVLISNTAWWVLNEYKNYVHNLIEAYALSGYPVILSY